MSVLGWFAFGVLLFAAVGVMAVGDWLSDAIHEWSKRRIRKVTLEAKLEEARALLMLAYDGPDADTNRRILEFVAPNGTITDEDIEWAKRELGEAK